MKQTECTTILVGKNATIDGSTMIARSEDGGRTIIPERFEVVMPKDHLNITKVLLATKRLMTQTFFLTLFATLVHLMHLEKTEFGQLLVSIQTILL